MASVRDIFFNRIYEMVKSGEDIYIITADLGAPSLDSFRKEFPERYISVGIAEQNLVSVSAGMALAGKKVIAYGLNPFPITRAFDQIRCLMAELNVPVTLCALNAGLCSSECGYTHMPIEDMAMLRTLSNITVYNPTDETISKMIADDTLNSSKPRIIRFDKTLTNNIYRDNEVELNQGFIVSGNKKNAKIGVVTNGCYIDELIKNSKIFGNNDVKVIDLFSLPVNEDKLIDELLQCKKVITIEENVLAGGIGSYILEILNSNEINKDIKRFGVNMDDGYYDVFTSRDYIRKDQKIDIDNIVDYITQNC